MGPTSPSKLYSYVGMSYLLSVLSKIRFYPTVSFFRQRYHHKIDKSVEYRSIKRCCYRAQRHSKRFTYIVDTNTLVVIGDITDNTFYLQRSTHQTKVNSGNRLCLTWHNQPYVTSSMLPIHCRYYIAVAHSEESHKQGELTWLLH